MVKLATLFKLLMIYVNIPKPTLVSLTYFKVFN
jgi:hypothetical protein